MDFGKSNHVANSDIRDFDLNKLPCMEVLDVNTEKECSTLIHTNTSHNDTDQAVIVANNSADGASSGDMRRHYVSSICFGLDGTSRGMLGGRRRYRRRGGVLLQSDPNRYCTNYYCKTRKTPLWRKGPLGPKTLCNACGIDYMKQVTSRGSGITTLADAVAVVPAANDDASTSAVPAEEGSDYSKGSSDV